MLLSRLKSNKNEKINSLNSTYLTLARPATTRNLIAKFNQTGSSGIAKQIEGLAISPMSTFKSMKRSPT